MGKDFRSVLREIRSAEVAGLNPAGAAKIRAKNYFHRGRFSFAAVYS
jgi:hypothetical protein